MATLAQSVAVPGLRTGAIKRFGEWGEIYEILGPAPAGRKGEMIQIRVVHTGETLAYPLADAVSDPLVP